MESAASGPWHLATSDGLAARRCRVPPALTRRSTYLSLLACGERRPSDQNLERYRACVGRRKPPGLAVSGGTGSHHGLLPLCASRLRSGSSSFREGNCAHLEEPP